MPKRQIKGSHIRNRRKILRMTQDQLLCEMITNGNKVGDKTISLWERRDNNTLQHKNYIGLCFALKIDPITQKPLCILEDESVISMCSKLKGLSVEARNIIFEMVDNITEDTIVELQKAQTLMNSQPNLTLLTVMARS